MELFFVASAVEFDVTGKGQDCCNGVGQFLFRIPNCFVYRSFACQATLNLNQKAWIPEVARSLKARKEFKGVGLYRGSLSVSTAKSVCYCQAVWDSGSATKGRSSVEWVFRVEGVGLFYVSNCLKVPPKS